MVRRMVRLVSLVVVALAVAMGEPDRPARGRGGRFLSTHLDLLSAASEIFPSAFRSEAFDTAESQRQVAVQVGEEEGEEELEEVGELGFGERLGAEARKEVEEVEEEEVEAREAFNGFSRLEEEEEEELEMELEEEGIPEKTSYQESAPARRPYGGYRRRPAPQPEPEPEPFVFICKDPSYCPPPSYPSSYGHRPSYSPGLTICRDPSSCPGPYGPPARPYRLRPRPPHREEEAPRYTAETTTRRPVKKYGYHPVHSNPTIYRQEVMGMDRQPELDIEDVKEVDIENMTMEELKEFIAAAEAEKEIPPLESEKLVVEEAAVMASVEQVLSNMNVAELVEFVKASSVLEAGVPVLQDSQVDTMTEPELKRVLEAAETLPKVLKQVNESDISKMTKEVLKEVVEDIMEDHEDDLKEMTKVELKEIVMEAVEMNPEEKPRVLKHVDMEDVSKMTKETLRKVAEEVIENKIETIEDMTKQELKELVMEVAVVNEELIIVPVAEEDIEQMNVKELKEFVKEVSEIAEEKPLLEVTENDVEQMTEEELVEFIQAAEEEESLVVSTPLTEVAILDMTPQELKEFVMEAVIETKLLEPILIPIREAELVRMSKEGLKELIMETPELVEKVLATEEASPEKEVTMKDIIKMQKKRKEEKPVKMLIKGGMLFKDGMTTEEKKADEMGMSVKEMITMTEGLTRSEVREIEEGVTVEEMIAIANDVSVEEMIAMKNDLTMEEVAEIKETMTIDEILDHKPEISVAEVIAIKNDMTVEEMVAMKNDVAVLEILEIKDKLSMNEIMKLQDGMTKEDIVAITSEEVSVSEVIEEKEGSIQLGGFGPPAAAPAALEEEEVLDITRGADQPVRFVEVTAAPPTPVPEILQPIRNTDFPERDILKLEMNRLRTKGRPEGGERRRPGGERRKPGGGLRMRPMRVKVRKPVAEVTRQAPVVESHLSFGAMETLMEEAFGLRDFPMMRPGEFVQVDEGREAVEGEVTNQDLVLEPTPAVPGRPVTEPRVVFQEFLDEPTPVPTSVAVDNIKTVDLAGGAFGNPDFPIYDAEPDVQAPPPNLPPTLLKSSDFPEMPIFSNFPMMQPGEFIQMEDGLEEYGSDEDDDTSFTAFNEIHRPESIDLFKAPVVPELRTSTPFDPLVSLVKEELQLPREERPFRSPRPRGRPTSHPNHRYPLFPSPTPFTARPATIEGESYMKNSYRHRLRPARQPYADDNTPHFREIPQHDQVKRLKRKKAGGFKAKQEMKPFVAFGSAERGADSSSDDGSMKGVNFYQQYGQHDDRPPVSRAAVAEEVVAGAEEEPGRRPGEVRFGGMSFALPPPGAFPDRPEEEEEKVSDIYPHHPVSDVFPNRPVSQVFRDIDIDQTSNPERPSTANQGITIEDTADIEVPGFANFFKDESSYLRNPFGGDFIKLEIDQKSFRTNKTAPSVHHIPLDIHGFPDAPSLEPMEQASTRPLFSKPPYKPPPVITRYEPPAESKALDYSHQLPAPKAAPPPATQGNSWRRGMFQDAMTNLPNAIRDLPAFMERLMGSWNQDWVSRAWSGRERDESAAA